MPSAATDPVHQVSPSPSVDLEMFCQSLVLQGLEVASTFKSYAENSLQRRYSQTSEPNGLLDAMMSLWGWVQRKHRSEEAEAAKELLLPLSQPVASPLTLQRTDFITESLGEMKTQLQLIHAVVDDLQAKGEQTDSKLNSLQEQLRRVPTCRCKPQEKSTHVVASSTKTFPSSSNAQNGRTPSTSRETPKLEIKRLEVPMEAVHRPSTLREHSDAILCWITQAIDGSYTHPDAETGQRFSLHVAKDMPPASGTPDAMHEILASAQTHVGQNQFEQQDGTNANADQDPAMDIAQIYRLLARDGGL